MFEIELLYMLELLLKRTTSEFLISPLILQLIFQLLVRTSMSTWLFYVAPFRVYLTRVPIVEMGACCFYVPLEVPTSYFTSQIAIWLPL